MKLQFKKQTYQAASVEAVVDCFQGQLKSTGVKYRVDPGSAKEPQQSLPGFDEVNGFKNESMAESSKGWIESFGRAEKELQQSQAEFQAANTARKEADSLAAIRRQDFDYFNNSLFLSQLKERKARIDEARQNAAQAAETIANCKVDSEVLQQVENLVHKLLTARARLESAAPSVRLRGIGRCDLQIDGAEATLAPEEVRDLPVSDRLKLVIPNNIEIEVAAGSSIDLLTREVEIAEFAIAAKCREVSVSDPEQARAAFQDRKEAERKIEERERIEAENLRDLSYDSLTDKLIRLEQTVPDYMTNRKSEVPIAKDLSAAKAEYHQAQADQTKCQEEWEAKHSTLDAARKIREKLSTEHETGRINLGSMKSNLDHLEASLEEARKSATDAFLEDSFKRAREAVTSEETIAKDAEKTLASKNPEKVKALTETATDSLATTKKRKEAAQTEHTEVQTRLKIHGEEGLHDKLQTAKSRLERLSSENRSLFRRAAAANLLFEVMSEERDKARQAYVAPLKERIERLGRLVFDETFQVELNENLQIVSRTSSGVTVPFDSLSGGTKEQLSLIFRLACSMIVAEDGGMPLIMDDALGYTDPERLRLMGAVLAKAAKDCQIVVLTCVPDRYAHVGEATIVSL